MIADFSMKFISTQIVRTLLAFPTNGEGTPERLLNNLLMERIWKQEVWLEDIESNPKDLSAERDDRFEKALKYQVRSRRISPQKDN